ncbi:MAG: pentapeptide repeat-containing protein [Candidatus Peribacteraceae bacterium]|nr:pentapeptide repeat-containing protein [Candidatus Peribacteraceae bacterium]
MVNLDTALNDSEITGTFQGDQSVLDFHWKNKNFHEAKIIGGSLSGSRFEDCSFTNVLFENVALDHVDFLRCSFDQCQLIHCAREGMEVKNCTGEPIIIG